MTSIIFAVIYALFYTATIKKILTTFHTVSTFSFSGFALTNLWLWLSNWLVIGSIWYFTAFTMWTITVICNLIITAKIKNKTITPKQL